MGASVNVRFAPKAAAKVTGRPRPLSAISQTWHVRTTQLLGCLANPHETQSALRSGLGKLQIIVSGERDDGIAGLLV
jgi:hypothetical protein